MHHHVGGCQEACQLLQQHEGPVARLHHCVKVGQYEAQALVSQFTLACHLRRESGGSCLDSTKLWHLSHMSVIWQGRRNPMSQTDTMKKIKKQVTNKLVSKQNSNCCSDILQPLPPPFRYFWRTAFIPLLQAAKHFQNTVGLVCPLCSVRYTEQPKNCSLCFETSVKHISLHYVGLQGSKNYHWAVEQHCIK